MLDNTMKAQLKAYLEKLTRPVELVSTLDDSAKSGEIRTLLQEIAELSPKVTVREDNSASARKPSFLIVNPGQTQGIRFAGSPLGHEFTSLVLALLQVGGHPSKHRNYWIRCVIWKVNSILRPTIHCHAITARMWCRH